MAEMSEQQERRRDDLIDIARVVAITLIVIGHTNIRSPYERGCPELSWLTVLGGWEIIMFFFFFAGYFTKNTKAWLNIKRSWQIFVALVIWAVIGYFSFGFISQLSTNGQIDIAALCSDEILCVIGDIYNSGTPGNYDLWFLKVLVVMSLFSPLISRLGNAHLLVLAIGFILLYQAQGCIPEWLLKKIPYFLKNRTLVYWSIFVSGILSRRIVSSNQISDFLEKVWPFILGMVVIYLVVSTFGVSNMSIKAQDPYFCRVLTILYVLSIAKGIQKLFPRFASWLASFGVSVFTIYVIQEILIIACRELFTAYPINKHIYTLIPFIIVALCMLIFRLCERCIPRLLPYVCLYTPKRKKIEY